MARKAKDPDQPSEKRETCVYSSDDTQRMMEGFEDRRAEVGDGGNFKISTCNAVAATLNPPEKGAPKIGKSVKNKYENVCNMPLSHFHSPCIA
jgi:hypothetical protein